jgi:hypothetical protein
MKRRATPSSVGLRRDKYESNMNAFGEPEFRNPGRQAVFLPIG